MKLDEAATSGDDYSTDDTNKHRVPSRAWPAVVSSTHTKSTGSIASPIRMLSRGIASAAASAAAAEGPAGLDALLSTVQMPPGIPVAAMAIGKAGAKNAAIFAVQILALSDDRLAKKLTDFRKSQSQKVIEKDSALQK